MLMPHFVAVYTVKADDIAAFRARPKAEQDAIDAAGLQAWENWSRQNAEAIVASDVMVGRTRRIGRSGVADARNQIAGFVVVKAADIHAATDLFRDHPHFAIFPGDGVDVMPVLTATSGD
jgi:hypothetical protein